MIRRPPRSTRTDTLFPYTTLFRSGGALAASVYSADAGGVSATTEEGFGTPDGVYPYLTTVHYETDNPLPWHREVALADVGARFRYPGSLTGVRMGRAGPSGRAPAVVLQGPAAAVGVHGPHSGRSWGPRSIAWASCGD